MAWAYRFVTLTPEQIEERRILLDRAGYFAWLSPVVLLTVVYLYRLATSSSTKEVLNIQDDQLVTPPSGLKVLKRRISWWLNAPLTPEFGSLKVHIIGLAYLGWLLFLIFRDTGDDYLHLTKRFSHVAVSQLPFQYLMAIKSTKSIAQIATGLSWENVNAYHRLFGRIIHVLAATHAIMYMNFFSQANLLSKRIGDWDVRLGLAAFWIMNILGLMAIPPIRKSAYHSFFKSHAILAGLTLPVLFFHVPHTRKYLYQAFACYMFNGMTRTKGTSASILSSVAEISGTSLLKLRIPGPAWGVPPSMGSNATGWTPGQHVFLKQGLTPKDPRSPFSIVSLPPGEGQDGDGSSSIDLVIRNLGGPTTGWLAAKSKASSKPDQNVEVLIEGPYGEAKAYVPELLRAGESAGTIMLVAGGVGATYALPIYLSLLQKRKSTGHIHFIWFVKSTQDAEWGIELLQAAKPEVDVAIYVTKESEKALSEKGGVGELKQGLKILRYGKRPNMKDVVDGVFSPSSKSDKTGVGASKDYGRVNVLSCGPLGMNHALRKEVGKHVIGYGRDVMYYEEQFGHGGS